MSDKRKYPKVYRMDNYKSSGHEVFPKDENLVIQEKLDGSNVTIEYDIQNGVFNLYSRTSKIDQENPGNWTAFVEWAQSKFDKIKWYAETQIQVPAAAKIFRLHGEWLMMAKLSYNKTHKNSFWLFDTYWETYDPKLNEFGMDEWRNLELIAKKLEINTVPVISFNEMTLTDLLAEGVDKYVENQKTLLPDSDSVREGIVCKLVRGGHHKMKFVSLDFKEASGAPRKKGVPLFMITGELITGQRIQKYLHKLKEEGILDLHIDYNDGQTMGTIFKNLDKLYQDFMDEEAENFLKLVRKQVKKEAGKSLKKYIEAQKKIFVEESENCAIIETPQGD